MLQGALQAGARYMQSLVIRRLAIAVLDWLHDVPGIQVAQDCMQTICAHSCDLRQHAAPSPKPSMKAVFQPYIDSASLC